MFKRFRPRRIDELTRRKYRETSLAADNFIWPVFIVPGEKIKRQIPSLPGVYHYSVDMLLPELRVYIKKGLSSILLFGIPLEKGIEQAYEDNGLVQNAVRWIKEEFPALEVITDVCLCSYSPDGHCHIGDNDRTCEILAKIAVSHAQAGADLVAPSDMMDGRVYFIKKAFARNKIANVKILSYAAKYASSFYGPFREAANCAPLSGDRKSYQMDIANSQEAMEEIAADLAEGADQIMIKPALAYLDIVAKARSLFAVPLVAYNVSGEYALLEGAGQEMILETLISIKRAGADRIATYFAPYVLDKLDVR